MTDARFVYVMGVDPGVVTGIVVIKVDRQRKEWALVERTEVPDVRDGGGLYDLNRAVRSRLSDSDKGFYGVAMEQLMAYTNSAQEKAEAQGVVRLSAYEARVPLYNYAPTTVRAIVVGSGKAKASDITKVARELTGLRHAPKGRPFSVHQQDALAVALCCALKEDLLKVLAPAVSEAALVPVVAKRSRKKEEEE